MAAATAQPGVASPHLENTRSTSADRSGGFFEEAWAAEMQSSTARETVTALRIATSSVIQRRASERLQLVLPVGPAHTQHHAAARLEVSQIEAVKALAQRNVAGQEAQGVVAVVVHHD